MKKTFFLLLSSIMFLAYSCGNDDDKDDIKIDTFVITTDVTVSGNEPEDLYSITFQIPNEKLVSYDEKNKDLFSVMKDEKYTYFVLSNTTFENIDFSFKSRNFEPYNMAIIVNSFDDDSRDIKLTGKVYVTLNNDIYIEQSINLDYFHPIELLIAKK